MITSKLGLYLLMASSCLVPYFQKEPGLSVLTELCLFLVGELKYSTIHSLIR
jgi:hypothetical protein